MLAQEVGRVALARLAPELRQRQHEHGDGDGHHGVDEGQEAIEIAMAFGHGRTLMPEAACERV